MKLNVRPSQVIAWTNDAIDRGELTKTQAKAVLTYWGKWGVLRIREGNYDRIITEEGFFCDCGKGLLCPENVTRPTTSNRHRTNQRNRA